MKHSTAKRTVATFLAALLLLSCMSVLAFADAVTPLSRCKVSVKSSVTYTGKAQKPAVTVKTPAGKKLKKGTDYTLTYGNNKKIGVAKVTVTAKKGAEVTGKKTVKFKIVPGKVKGLAASKVKKTVAKLTWKAVKGANSYAIYTYDKAAKTYSRVQFAKGKSAVVKKLTPATSYNFVVRALAKVGGKNYWGAYSAPVKVKTVGTKPASTGNPLDKYRKIFESGTYMMTFKTNDPDVGDQPITFATKNGNFSVDSKIQLLDFRLIYNAKENKTYLLLKSLKKYTEVTEEMMGDDFDPAEMTAGIFSEFPTETKTGSIALSGKTYRTETAQMSDGSTACYIFDGDELVRIDTISPDGTTDSVFISSLTADVPDSMFEIPKGYSYMNLDWLMENVA